MGRGRVSPRAKTSCFKQVVSLSTEGAAMNYAALGQAMGVAFKDKHE